MTEKWHPVFVALGANLGPQKQTLEQVCQKLKQHPSSRNFYVSEFYRTTPVSEIPQPDFINAVARFETTLSPKRLHQELQQIEHFFGKTRAHVKDAPRKIDLDLLFYGSLIFNDKSLTLPHPRWKERLFVLQPLSDVADQVQVGSDIFNIKNLIENFTNNYQEKVIQL